MWKPEKSTSKITILAVTVMITVGLHYGWLIDPFFGHVHWIHAIHGRFCYIPIIIAATWFGLRGGLYMALLISAVVSPLIYIDWSFDHKWPVEVAEIIMYFAIGGLGGGLIERENRAKIRAEKLREELEHSKRLSMVGQMAAGVAHEIKNPLASIKGAVEILSDDNISKEEQTEFKEMIIREIHRMNKTVMEFLEFARPTQAAFEKFNLDELVTAAVHQLSPQASERAIRLQMHRSEGTVVFGDSEKIHQSVLNILLNAIEATPDGATIDVYVDRNAETAAVRIVDQGDGISVDDKAKIFEPFFTTKAKGTGLGLAIVQAIVQNHGGEITIEDNKSTGATVSLILPLQNNEE